MRFMANELALKASKAWYESGKVCLLLEDGVEIRFSIKLNAKLANASEEDLSKIELICKGTGIHWPLLDEDLSVIGVLEGRFGGLKN